MSATTAEAAVPTAIAWRRTLPLAGALLSGLLLAYGYALHPIPAAGLLAPAPILAACLANHPSRAWRLGVLSGAIGGLSTLTYHATVMGWPQAILVLALTALLWGGTIRAADVAFRRLPLALAVWALPAFTAGLDMLVMTLSPFAADGMLAYSVLAWRPLTQIAALGGVPAIAFVMATAASLAAILLAAPLTGLRPRPLATALAAPALLLAATLTYGAFRLAQPATGPTRPITLITTNRFPGEPTSWTDVWSVYEPAIRAAARPGATVILPEKIARLADATPALLDLSALARATNQTILLGLETRDPSGAWVNRAELATPAGAILPYDKQFPVPGLEARDRPGHANLLTQIDGATAGIAICRDIHIPSLARAYAREGAALMLVPAWDFGRDAFLSARLSELRGIESGAAIARSARDGIASLTDRTGRIIAQAPSTTAMTTVQSGITLSPASPTLYARIGNLFGWLSLAAAIALLAAARSAAAPRSPIRR